MFWATSVCKCSCSHFLSVRNAETGHVLQFPPRKNKMLALKTAMFGHCPKCNCDVGLRKAMFYQFPGVISMCGLKRPIVRSLSQEHRIVGPQLAHVSHFPRIIVSSDLTRPEFGLFPGETAILGSQTAIFKFPRKCNFQLQIGPQQVVHHFPTKFTTFNLEVSNSSIVKHLNIEVSKPQF